MAAFNKRCNFRADDDVSDEMYALSCNIIDALPRDFDHDPWEENELDRQRWMDKFGKAKQDRMQRAYDDIEEHDARTLGTKTIFVKREALLKRDDPTWAPRIVYMGPDSYNAVTGPAAMVAMERLITTLEGPLKEGRELNNITPMFGYKRSDVTLSAHLAEGTHVQCIEGDYSRNDREQRARVVQLFTRFLRHIGMPEWYINLEIAFNKFKVINYDMGLVAWIENQLPTGVTVTTCRNSFYNWLQFTVAMTLQGVTARCLILGDDLLAVTQQHVDLDQWIAVVAAFKMVLKAKQLQLHALATFLSRRFCIDTTTPCMFPLIGKALFRFNVRATENPALTDSQYMAGKVLSYAYEFRHVPMMRDAFLKRYLMEDHSSVSTDELTWFTKTSNLSISEIIAAIHNEQVVLTRDEFEMCILEAYEIDTIDLQEMLDAVITSTDCTIYDHPCDVKLLVDV